MKRFVEYEVEGPRPRGRPKRTWREIVEKDCQARKLNKEDAMDRSKWRKLIQDVRWSGWVWVGACFFWYRPTRVVRSPGPKGVKRLCVCVCFVPYSWPLRTEYDVSLCTKVHEASQHGHAWQNQATAGAAGSLRMRGRAFPENMRADSQTDMLIITLLRSRAEWSN